MSNIIERTLDGRVTYYAGLAEHGGGFKSDVNKAQVLSEGASTAEVQRLNSVCLGKHRIIHLSTTGVNNK